MVDNRLQNGDVSVPSPVFSGGVTDEGALEYLLSVRAAERRRVAQELHELEELAGR